MKYTVTIANQSYEVEVEDVNARPIVAHVDGERFEVHPGREDQAVRRSETQAATPRDVSPTFHPTAVTPAASGNTLTAPLPGTVVEVFVKSGDEIDAGHVVMVIEAMKMKNSIRATRSGKVAEVLAAAGQTVAHKQPLVRFE